MDKACRVTVLLEDSSKEVNFLLKVVLHADNRMMGLDVEILIHVYVGFL